MIFRIKKITAIFQIYSDYLAAILISVSEWFTPHLSWLML